MTDPLSQRFTARLGALLFLVSGAATFLRLVLPGVPPQAPGVTAVGATALLTAVAVRLLPFDRWPRRALLGPLLVALVLVAVDNYYSADPYRYSGFFVVCFAWLGLTQPRRTSLLLLPAFVVAYLAPLVLADAPGTALWSLAYVLPVCVLVSEALAWLVEIVRRNAAELARMAYEDALTGLPNRAATVEHLHRALDASVARCRVALLFCDLDGFKQVNDLHGHAAGDELLRHAAGVLRAAVPAGQLVGRLGGDEFLVVLTGPAGAAAEATATALLERLRADPLLASVGVTVSIGIAVTGEVSLQGGELLRRADLAMYQAKSAGRARAARFEEVGPPAPRPSSPVLAALPAVAP